MKEVKRLMFDCFIYYDEKDEFSFEDINNLYDIDDVKTQLYRNSICVDHLVKMSTKWSKKGVCTNDKCFSLSEWKCKKCDMLLCSQRCIKTHLLGCVQNKKDL
jgi:hypothetical protein